MATQMDTASHVRGSLRSLGRYILRLGESLNEKCHRSLTCASDKDNPVVTITTWHHRNDDLKMKRHISRSLFEVTLVALHSKRYGYISIHRLWVSHQIISPPVDNVISHELTMHSVIMNETLELTKETEIIYAQMVEASLAARYLADDFYHQDYTREEIEQIIAQGRQAWEKLYRAHLPLVYSLAKKWALKTGLRTDELIQEGMVALGESMQRWDWKRNVRLSTYAWTFINASLAHCSATRCGEYEMSDHQARLAWQVKKTRRRLENQGYSQINLSQIARALGRDKSLLEASLMERISYDEYSIQISCEDQSPDDDKEILYEWLDDLPDDERVVLVYRYGIGCNAHTREELSRLTGRSSSALRRIEQRALRRIRRYIAEEEAA